MEGGRPPKHGDGGPPPSRTKKNIELSATFKDTNRLQSYSLIAWIFSTMIPQWLIEKKRDGLALSEDEIQEWILAYTSGVLPDYQMSAMAMAIFFRGMNPDEIAAMTRAMMLSGIVLDWPSIAAPKVDKHSTGGIGDKVSIILAPLAAELGLAVPMISGRGLGITGGTLDKLESIPGYRTRLSSHEMKHVLEQCGCSMVGQTDDLVPADRKLYALRDVTGTVPSIPLIVSSIMSKKLAAGLDALVLDVKWGSGAFMPTQQQARLLAESLVDVGKRMGKRMAALITDMNHPLGRTVGNSLEIRESIETLQGNGPDDLSDLTIELCAAMLVLGKLQPGLAPARQAARERLRSGRAFARFRRMVELHGGDPTALDAPDRLPHARIHDTLRAPRAGWLERIDAGQVGRACLILGAGRQRVTDPVDFGVGVSDIAGRGRPCKAGDVLADIHANSENACVEARHILEAGIHISEGPVTPQPLIAECIGM